MINYETILSLFDDKLTLLEYLTKIEQALQNEKLTNITVTQTDASHVYFTFVFEDGSTIDTPTFTLPKGDTGATGATGADGVSVVDADIDASGHLILTLSNGNTIDAGATGLQTVTADDIDSEEATQYEVLKADGDGGATWGRVTDGDIADNNQVGQYLGSTGYGFSTWKKFEIPGTLVTSGGGTQGQVLTADGNGGASWENASGGTKLNKYTKTFTTETNNERLAFLYKVLTNAKGNILDNPCSLTLGGNNYSIITSHIKALSSINNYLKIIGNVYRSQSNGILVFDYAWVANSYTGTAFLINTNGTITNITNTPTVVVNDITYYNDIEIT